VKIIKLLALALYVASTITLMSCNEKKDAHGHVHKTGETCPSEVAKDVKHTEDDGHDHQAEEKVEHKAQVHKHQTNCPVTGTPIDTNCFVEKEGKKIFVANEACKEEVSKNFAKYEKQLEEHEGLHLGQH